MKGENVTLAQVQVEIRRLRKLLDKEPISWFDTMQCVDAIERGVEDGRDAARQVHLLLSDVRNELNNVGGAS